MVSYCRLLLTPGLWLSAGAGFIDFADRTHACVSLLSVSKTACIEAPLLIQWAELVVGHQQEGAVRFAHPILFEHFVCIRMSTKSDFPLLSNLVHILTI
jgi:hypothetical protein